MLQSKRANLLVFDIFCYIQESIQREHIWVYGVDTKYLYSMASLNELICGILFSCDILSQC